ncbi:ribonucleases P/MRP protein subunit POP1-like isoform X1 [Syzygium oleosum]|uniref:ribonucleases P/MRP protein subunit POP1-like isoform X1 n=1 Tax=Syzygium oleosum TaxID=219896 RepID=UPI0024B9CF44|nr:ribonucleases P/MRP protein subunit POP1-like isoform X1 [Syzygium oleosum]XP_056174508.1 ribonucleases P/MRP protein subunit POP1-like isoform X1 [Syzygium oleosum]XP_056174509.1 ribonucleases P/MRP protein subunit POP1-like isoform X1 [Syzygium oleosum]
MGSDGSKRSVAPRTLSVRKFAESRAAEVENLHSIVANRLSNNFRSRRDKRRRTTAHDNQLANRRHRKRRKDSPVAGADRNPAAPGKVPRRVRRRNELKQNPESGFCTSGDGTRRLRTHVWHAKRFTMTKLWGFYLPLGLHGRGRGSRALLKWYKQGVVIHDASYHFAVQFEGPEDSLISVLDRVLVPSPSAHPMDMSHSILSGVTYGRALLHHVGTPLSKPIAPVMYMWRHLDQHNTEKVQQDCANGEGVPENIDDSVPFRQLWVWIHVSAFTEGYAALKCACQKEMDEVGSLIRCSSLEGHLAKLEIMGSGAFKLLQKILHPIKHAVERPFQLKKHSSVEASMDEKKMECDLLHNEDGFPSHAIFSLMVKDPREYMDEENFNDSKMIALSTVDEVLSHVTEKQPSITQPVDKGGGLLLLSQAHHGLWDAASGLRTPIEENVLHTERHKKRMDFLCLDNFNSGMSNSLDSLQSSRSCPIMLLRNGSADDRLKGWSIVLPLSWVKAFWIPLISKGAHAVGLREKHWIANNAYLPYFPWDYPDCNAYTSLMAIEAAASHSKADRRPPAVRALKVPIPPPWSTICSFDKAFTAGVNTLISSERSTSNSSSPSNLTNSSSGVTSSRLRDHMCGFRGSVVRTNKELTCFLEDNYGGHSFLFPYNMVRDRSFLKALKDQSNVGGLANGISRVMARHDLCFLRVILHALKEGFFEEGAIVCAPHFTDISSRDLRLENNEIGLQMPQSAAASYFKEVRPGEWEIQVPEDPIARESHRWPIGFVTTGFVRGSEKPTAEAFCEVNYLAHLREEQWTEMSVERRKKEIYVLVRNMRSSAYRLALATIVLEQQEDDLEFM